MKLTESVKSQRRPSIGTLLTIPQAAVVETLSHCGFDWFWIDMEHAPLSLEQVERMLVATGGRAKGFVRIPINDEVWIKRVLDLGADGIIVPQVKNREEALKAVQASKYPPQGTRSVGLARAQGFGTKFADYIQTANDNVEVLLQIEHCEGVKNVDAILQVEGVDGIIIGPYDLSGSYNLLGQVEDRVVVDAIDTIFGACQRHSMPVGIFAMKHEQGEIYLKKGFQLLALGVDVHYLWSAAKASLEKVTAVNLIDAGKA